MTPRQEQLLAFIKSYAAAHNGVTPSFEEMRQAIELRSKSGVQRLIDALVAQGLLERTPGHARNIRITPERQAEATTLLTQIVDRWFHDARGDFNALMERAREVVS